MVRIFRLLALALFLFALCGCSIITRPPSAATFMNSYNKEFSGHAINFAFYSGDLVCEKLYDKKHDKNLSGGYDIIDSYEWPVDFTYTYFLRKSHFTVGLGIQIFTPFLQPGFVSEYFGVMGWSGMLPFGSYEDKGNWKTDGFSFTGGISTIQQLPLDENLRIGVAEHLSRNGRESRWKDSECGGSMGPTGECLGETKSILYTEVGVGAYLSYKSIAIEFRYGRDISEKRDRYTLSLDWMFAVSKDEPQKEWIWR
ncbi:MAG: hypothetical protein IKS96_03945 [Fibrobacter sp.]|nr:hypothetical protein [Fibrobacter sp.]